MFAGFRKIAPLFFSLGFIVMTHCSPANRTSSGAVADSASVADVEPFVKDSLEYAGELFNKQLKLAGIDKVDIFINRAGNKGLSLLLTNEAERSGIPFPASLKAYNAEGYYTKAGKSSIIIVGNSALALRHAIFNYLEQLGYRYFLPSPDWQVIPSLRTPYVDFQRLAQPAYEYRHFANGHGFNKNKNLQEQFDFWALANQMGGSFPVTIGHVYQTIVSNNKETFKEHPEYFAGNIKKGDIPVIAKFNVANKGLVELVKKDAVARIREARRIGHSSHMISMEPSDGGGFCESADCRKIGGPSEQVFYLANEVARHIRKEFPGVWVGSLAYNEHILPVKQKLEPNVFVMITNGFNRTKYSTNELLKLWSQNASKLGIYEYLNVFEWDNDLPGRSNASQLSFLKKSIAGYYQNGARAYIAETNMGWVSKGLGQYVAARLLWNPSLNIDSLANDFYSKAFGPAANEIRKLYESWERAPKGMLGDNLLADWLQWVEDAGRRTTDKTVLARLDHLKIYLHYLVLYKRLKTNPTAANMNAVLVFANRTFETGAFATFPVMVSLPKYSGFESLGFYNNSGQAWKKNNQPVSSKEINSLFQADRQSVKRVEGVKSFSEASDFDSKPVKPAANSLPVLPVISSFIGETKFALKIEKQSSANFIEIKSGYSARPEQDKPVTIKVYRYDLYQQIKQEADVVLSDTQWSKAVPKKISLSKLEPGEYMVEVNDQLKIFNIRFQGDIRYNLVMSSDRVTETSSIAGLNNFYFVVPGAVKKIIVHKSKTVKLRSPAGRVIEFMENKQDSHTVEILKGEEGMWQVFYQVGNLFIEGVPPYLGMEPGKFLMPVGSY